MLFQTPYDTTYLSLLNIDKAKVKISEYILLEYSYIQEKKLVDIKDFVNNDIYLKPIFLFGLSSTENEIENFSQPIINEKEKWTALDLRQFVKPIDEKRNIEVRNEYEYKLQLDKFILSNLWYTGKNKELKDLKFAQVVFSSWLSDNLTKRFGLDLGDSLKLKTLALIYFNSLFTDNFTKEDVEKLIVKYKSDFFTTEELILDVYEKVGNSLTNIESFCSACYTVTGNIRLKGFSTSVLGTIISNSWYGLNSKENIMVSLEYPPVFISLVYNALTNKGFSKSYLSQLVAKLDKKNKGDEFKKHYEEISGNYLAVK